MVYDSPGGLIAAAVIMQILVLLMIGSRIVSHNIKGPKSHPSDYLIIVASVLSTALAIEQIYCIFPSLRSRDMSCAIFSNLSERTHTLAMFRMQ
jgi:hypothetical protein